MKQLRTQGFGLIDAHAYTFFQQAKAFFKSYILLLVLLKYSGDNKAAILQCPITFTIIGAGVVQFTLPSRVHYSCHLLFVECTVFHEGILQYAPDCYHNFLISEKYMLFQTILVACNGTSCTFSCCFWK